MTEFEKTSTHYDTGPAKAAKIKAAIELGQRVVAEAIDEPPAAHSTQYSADLVRYVGCP